MRAGVDAETAAYRGLPGEALARPLESRIIVLPLRTPTSKRVLGSFRGYVQSVSDALGQLDKPVDSIQESAFHGCPESQVAEPRGCQYPHPQPREIVTGVRRRDPRGPFHAQGSIRLAALHPLPHICSGPSSSAFSSSRPRANGRVQVGGGGTEENRSSKGQLEVLLRSRGPLPSFLTANFGMAIRTDSPQVLRQPHVR